MQLNCNRVEISGRRSTRAIQIIDADHILDRLDGAEGSFCVDPYPGAPSEKIPGCPAVTFKEVRAGPARVERTACSRLHVFIRDTGLSFNGLLGSPELALRGNDHSGREKSDHAAEDQESCRVRRGRAG